MSVVNKMLQDLEQRQNGQIPDNEYRPPRSGSGKTWILGSLVIILMMVVAWLWWQGHGAPEPASPATTSSSPQSTHSADTAVAPVVNQAQPQAEVVEDDTVLNPQSNEAAPSPSMNPERRVSLGVAATPMTQPQTDLSTREQPASVTTPSSDMTINETAPKRADEQTTEQSNALPEEEDGTMSVASSSAGVSVMDFQQQVELALAEGDDAGAMLVLQQWLKITPGNGKARKQLAALQFANGQVAQARDVLQQGLAQAPEHDDIRTMLARLYVQQNDQQQALALLKEAPATSGPSPQMLALRAALAARQQDNTTALQDYQYLVRYAPDNSSWRLGLAIALERAGKNHTALSEYRILQQQHSLSDALMSFVDQRIGVLEGGS
ncbi:tetratricopeptide repeat protein [Aestuariibacter halophilus]|uniref:Tetratricopeptide repeat protein n=1 Tax=Fluctibacter halophilus TaxID=226011 RepID=A0ABS8GAV1_9ALTE|nr:tetratricopeptide repeat protein [Aestuariibacter halophilus]MCC2617638.1 tetratricopeptide repeat protein [Aestuariibacter halophilus]